MSMILVFIFFTNSTLAQISTTSKASVNSDLIKTISGVVQNDSVIILPFRTDEKGMFYAVELREKEKGYIEIKRTLKPIDPVKTIHDLTILTKEKRLTKSYGVDNRGIEVIFERHPERDLRLKNYIVVIGDQIEFIEFDGSKPFHFQTWCFNKTIMEWGPEMVTTNKEFGPYQVTHTTCLCEPNSQEDEFNFITVSSETQTKIKNRSLIIIQAYGIEIFED